MWTSFIDASPATFTLKMYKKYISTTDRRVVLATSLFVFPSSPHLPSARTHLKYKAVMHRFSELRTSEVEITQPSRMNFRMSLPDSRMFVTWKERSIR